MYYVNFFQVQLAIPRSTQRLIRILYFPDEDLYTVIEKLNDDKMGGGYNSKNGKNNDDNNKKEEENIPMGCFKVNNIKLNEFKYPFEIINIDNTDDTENSTPINLLLRTVPILFTVSLDRLDNVKTLKIKIIKHIQSLLLGPMMLKFNQENNTKVNATSTMNSSQIKVVILLVSIPTTVYFILYIFCRQWCSFYFIDLITYAYTHTCIS